jgi:FHA domain
MSNVKCAYCDSDLATGALFCGQCGRPVSTAPTMEKSGTGKTNKKATSKTVAAETEPSVKDPPHAPTGERFVLQFSTGESVSVFGTGLIGRHPVAEPGEYFDQAVTIVDPSKSVSKTHLEFGQSSGAFWISDRFSGNGTIVREPDSEPRRCDAGKRYRIVRGTRVSIGEQFFVVS